jgi:hypothetical protein
LIGHPAQSVWTGEKSNYGVEQLFRRLQLSLLKHYGCSGLKHDFRVAALVVIGSRCEWDKERGLSRCR